MKSCFIFHGITSCTLKKIKKIKSIKFSIHAQAERHFQPKIDEKVHWWRFTVMFTFTMNDGEDPQTADSTKLQKEFYIIYFSFLSIILHYLTRSASFNHDMIHMTDYKRNKKERSSEWGKIELSIITISFSTFLRLWSFDSKLQKCESTVKMSYRQSKGCFYVFF